MELSFFTLAIQKSESPAPGAPPCLPYYCRPSKVQEADHAVALEVTPTSPGILGLLQ